MASDSPERSRMERGWRTAAVAVAVIVIALGAVVAAEVHGRDVAVAEATLARDLVPVVAAVSGALVDLDAGAAGDVEAALRTGRGAAAVGAVIDVGTDPEAVVARDGGDPVLLGPGQRSQALAFDTVAVLVPLYEVDGRRTTDAPAGTDARRRSSAGVVFVDRSVALGAVAGQAAGPALEVGLVGSEMAGLAESSLVVPVGDPVLGLGVLGTGEGSGQSSTGLVLATAAVLALAAGLGVDRAGHRIVRDARALAGAERDLATVAEIAPVAQQSLEVGDVLPAVAVAMIDGFGLRNVAVTVRRGGAEVELFSARGGRIGAEGANETLELSLDRGNRRLGTLVVETDAPLRPRQRALLEVLSDMIAGSLANAALYDQQQAAVARLREVDELKTVFLATASHELRTPITAIAGFAGLLDSSWDQLDEDERRQFAGRIVANAHSLERLIAQLLDFSRMEGGRLDEGGSLEVAEVLEGMRAQLESQVPDHQLVVALGSQLWVRATEAAIERIVTNLVGNAAKFSPAGSTIAVRASAVAAEGGADEVRLVVDDEGPGVPPAERSRIFERFYRSSSEETVRTRGAGVGLSIVSDFVHALDGTIEVTDAPDGGARFIVTFPAVEPLAPGTEPDHPEAASAQ